MPLNIMTILSFNFSTFMTTGFKLGIIFCIMTLGVHISYRILDMADLSIEGTFPLGACICALILSINFGNDTLNTLKPVIGTLAAIVAGGIGGFITGFLATKCKIPAILSGIITMTGLYSINLLILGLSNKDVKTLASLSVKSSNTIFAYLVNPLKNMGMDQKTAIIVSTIAISLIIMLIIYRLVYKFFGTEFGMSVRATGDNQAMAKAQGIDTSFTRIFGLVLSNALIALAGALFAQNNGAANVTSGRGMIVIGLAAIVIGEIIFGRKSYSTQLFSMFIGTLIYFYLRSAAIELKVIEMLDLVSALLIAIILSFPLIKEKVLKINRNARNKKKEPGEVEC